MNPTVVRATQMPPGTPLVPVAIVGAGACGLTAALLLRDAGIDCVLLERDARPQGSTGLSSGFIPAAGTRVQREAGVLDDSAERFAQDIHAKAHGSAAPHLVAAFTQAIAPALDALQSRHGLSFELLSGFRYPGHGVLRMHTLAQRTGAALVAALEAALQRPPQAAPDGAPKGRPGDAREPARQQAVGDRLHGAPPAEPARADAVLMTNALVRELWCDDGGRVVGVGWLRPDGTRERLACGALLLACNGFGGNPAMVRELLPAMRDAAFAGHAGNDGSAIAWGRQLGARLADLGGCQGHGSWAVPQGALISWALMMEGGIQVNAHGRRFHDETGGYSEASVQVLAQPGGVAWNVFDARLLALGRTFPDFVAAEAAGAVRHAGDLFALAKVIGCDTATLSITLAGKRLAAPYGAIRVTGALFHTQGGLDIDAHCRVLREDGTPFPNLLAAGGAARGVSGNAIWGYLSGNGLLSAVAGGYIAAQTAAGRVAKHLAVAVAVAVAVAGDRAEAAAKAVANAADAAADAAAEAAANAAGDAADAAAGDAAAIPWHTAAACAPRPAERAAGRPTKGTA